MSGGRVGASECARAARCRSLGIQSPSDRLAGRLTGQALGLLGPREAGPRAAQSSDEGTPGPGRPSPSTSRLTPTGRHDYTHSQIGLAARLAGRQ
ncbi:unnamed protein product [Protopolystoma xenopodis]|uniref:Uncharacterized protein n=1 Tax=Protopolystoma xenopodis TaxID=117903 RepID=A0A448XRC9_9PLAT|nr:unnamed protein product [Protopolystoma xenopodis]